MPTALIIGAGSNIGQATADAFEEAGYKVAVASRSTKPGLEKHQHFALDTSQVDTVRDVFRSVTEAVGIPSVVIYNAYAAHIDRDPFALPLTTFQQDMNVNATSAWIAANEAVKGFEVLAAEDEGFLGGTFIFTGNLLNTTAAPGFLTFGMGKAAAAHLIQGLALASFADKPFTFYYCDQRLADGKPMLTGLSGEAHGKLYLELAQDPEQRPWLQTFVKDKGYVEFAREEVWNP